MASFTRHVFVCTNQRDPSAPRGSCTPDGKGKLHKLFKDGVAEAGLSSLIRVNKAGCLDQCEHGPVVVVYPEQVWYGFVQPSDVDEVVSEHLVMDRPVSRLVLPQTCVNTAGCPHKTGGRKGPGIDTPDASAGKNAVVSGVL